MTAIAAAATPQRHLAGSDGLAASSIQEICSKHEIEDLETLTHCALDIWNRWEDLGFSEEVVNLQIFGCYQILKQDICKFYEEAKAPTSHKRPKRIRNKKQLSCADRVALEQRKRSCQDGHRSGGFVRKIGRHLAAESKAAAATESPEPRIRVIEPSITYYWK